jgi:predicted ATPase
MEPLARLITEAAGTSQIWLTTHSHRLTAALSESLGVTPIALEKVDGATRRAARAVDS